MQTWGVFVGGKNRSAETRRFSSTATAASKEAELQGPGRRRQKSTSGDGQTGLVLGTPSPAGLETRASTALKSTNRVCVWAGLWAAGTSRQRPQAKVGSTSGRPWGAPNSPPQPGTVLSRQPAAAKFGFRAALASRGSRYPQPAAAPGRSPALRPQLPQSRSSQTKESSRSPGAPGAGVRLAANSPEQLGDPPRPRLATTPTTATGRLRSAAPPAPLLLAAPVRANHLPSSL